MPYQYQTAANPYALSIADILARRGDVEAQRATAVANAQARAAEVSGNAWGRALDNVGQTIAAIPQQIAQQKREAQQGQATQLQIDEATRKAAAQKAVELLPFYASGQGREAQLASLDGPARELAMAHYQQADEAKARLDQIAASTRAQNLNAEQSQQQIDAAQMDVFGALAAGVKAHNYDPGAFFAATADAVHKGLLPLDQAGPMVAHAIQNPDWIKSTTDELIARSPQQQALEDKRASEARMEGTAKAAADNLTADNARADAAAKETERHNKAMENRPVAGAAGKVGDLTPDAVEQGAARYRILGASSIPTRIEEPDRVAIMNKAAEQDKALGNTPAASVQKMAAYKSDATALTQMRKMSSAAEAFETKASAQADLIDKLSAKTGRTDWPLVNGLVLSGKISTGDTNAQLLANAILGFQSEYAKILEGSTGSVAAVGEGSAARAQKMVSGALSKGTLKETLSQMRWEMKQTMNGYDTVIGSITDRMGGAQSSATTPPAQPASAGVSVTAPNGKTYSFKSQADADAFKAKAGIQ